MKLETTKGEFTGNATECVAWLNEMQPSHASVVIGEHSVAIDAEPDTWSSGLRAAVVEFTEDIGIEGYEDQWQQYLSIDEIAELIDDLIVT